MAKDFAKEFYHSEAWIKCREAYLSERLWTCERCGKPAVIVHHKRYITPSNIGDPDVTLGFDNLEALCQDCHNKEHFGVKAIRRYTFDDSGNMIPTPP